MPPHTDRTTLATEAFEVWLDENQKEPWPPTRESLARFAVDTGAVAPSNVENVWVAYSKEGFKVVREDGSVHCCESND